MTIPNGAYLGILYLSSQNVRTRPFTKGSSLSQTRMGTFFSCTLRKQSDSEFRPGLPGPLYQAVLQFLPVMHGASSLGIAEGALEELAELPIPAPSSCGPLCRCGIRKHSKPNSAVSKPNQGRHGPFSRSRQQAIGVRPLPER